MKKILCFLLLVTISFSLGFSAFAYETGEIYTWGDYTITILDDNKCKVKLDDDNEVITKYEVLENGNFYMSTFDTELVLNEDNTLSKNDNLTYDNYITIKESDGGIVEASILGGNVGDVVVLNIKPEFLYDIEQVIVNGETIQADENGEYKFSLIGGENIVTTTFVVSEAKLEKIAEIISSAKNNKWDEVFTVSNLIQLISWAITGLMGSGFLAYLWANRKKKIKTPDEMITKITDNLGISLSKSTEALIVKLITPFFDKVSTRVDNVYDVMMTLCKCCILMQDGTPESRLAIANELAQLKTSDDKLAAQVKKIIEDEMLKNKENEANLQKSIEELETLNKSIDISEDNHL